MIGAARDDPGSVVDAVLHEAVDPRELLLTDDWSERNLFAEWNSDWKSIGAGCKLLDTLVCDLPVDKMPSRSNAKLPLMEEGTECPRRARFCEVGVIILINTTDYCVKRAGNARIGTLSPRIIVISTKYTPDPKSYCT